MSTRRPSGTSAGSAPDSKQQPKLSPEEEAQLLARKTALFGNRTTAAGGVASSPTGAPEKKESAAQEAARIRAEADASLSQLALDLNGDDDGGQHASDSLDLTTQDIDFDGLGGDLRAFEQHSLVQEALEKEQDLRNYSRDIDEELKQYEKACVQDYIQDADQLSTLHGQIKSCDGILATMESMLSHFQSDLSAISSEIQFLQEKSYGMNIKLRNYKHAEKSLNAFIQHIYIPDDLCNLILEGELNEPFVSGLIELDKKLMFLENGVNRREQPFSLAAKDMQPIGEKLKIKCIARIRAFLLERFHSLKKPKTNIQIKQKLLLKFAYFYQFLLHHADERAAAAQLMNGGGSSGQAALLQSQGGSGMNLLSGSSASGGIAAPSTDICSEIRREYHETISAIYYTKFKKYLGELKKLQQDQTVGKEDLLGKDAGDTGGGGGAGSSSGGMGSMLSGLSSAFSSKKPSSAIDHVFTLHGREEVLLGAAGDAGVSGPGAAGDRELIIPALAASGAGSGASAKLPFEKLFRSAQSLLMDTSTSEYDFIVEFFGERMARDMDRAGVFEEDVEKEKEKEREEGERKEKEKAERASGNGSSQSGGPLAKKAPSYSQSQSDERGREHLLPGSRDKHLFNLVFGKTIALFLDHLETFLKFECHDALGILLLIRVVCQHNIQMQYRRVHCLDHVFDRMNMMLSVEKGQSRRKSCMPLC